MGVKSKIAHCFSNEDGNNVNKGTKINILKLSSHIFKKGASPRQDAKIFPTPNFQPKRAFLRHRR